MDLTRLFDRFFYGNNIYQADNILENAPPTKHHGVISVWYILNNYYQVLLFISQ